MRHTLLLLPGLCTSSCDGSSVGGPPAPTLLEVSCRGTDNPLRYRCTVTVEPAQAVALTYARTDGLSVERGHTSDEARVHHEIPIHFLAPATEHEVLASPVAWPGEVVSQTFTAGVPPIDVRSSLQITGTSTAALFGTHNPCNDDAVAVIYDAHTGDLVWYHELDRPGALGVLDMIQFTEDHTVLGESRGDLIEVDLAGQDLIRLEDLDQHLGGGDLWGLHHDVFKRDGTYYVMYQEQHHVGGEARGVLDVVVLVDGSGAELGRWFPDEHLELPADWGGDWLHTNTIYVDEAGDIYLSWRHQHAIGKIEGDPSHPDFGTPIWILGGSPRGELGSDLTLDWSQIGGIHTFEEPHSLNLTPDGRVILLDNPHGRGLIIDVDEGLGVAAVEGAYDTREPVCGPQGTARTTAVGNPVVGCNGDWVREYDVATGALAWEAGVRCVQEGQDDSRTGAVRWYPLDGW